MTRCVTAVVGVLVFAFGAWAQNSPPHNHSAANVQTIDGAKNPELIPDNTAFRLWLVTVSTLPNASVQERERQEAHFNRLHFSSPLDRPLLQSILTNFKSQYTSLINHYNEAQKAAWASGPVPIAQQQADLKLLLEQRDELVAATRVAITNQLSTEGANHVMAHVVSEKQFMKIVAKEGQ